MTYKFNCVLTINEILIFHGQLSQNFVQTGYRFPVFFIFWRHGRISALFQFILLPSQVQWVPNRCFVGHQIHCAGFISPGLGSAGRSVLYQKTHIYIMQFYQYPNMGILSLYSRFLADAVHHHFLRDILFSDHFLPGSLYHGRIGNKKEKLWKDEGMGVDCIYYDGSFTWQSHRYLLY